MLDLKIVEADQYDLVPVPLPGRLIVFAGETGLMCRRNDGTIANYPDAGGGGGAGNTAYMTLPLLDDYPANPAPGFAHVFATPNGVRMLDEYGDILGNHESGGGGGIVEPVETIEFSTVSVGESMPLPATGRYRLGMVGANLAIIYTSGLVIKVEDGSIIYDPSAGGGPV